MEFQGTYMVLGGLQIRYYGIIVVAALLAGAYVAVQLARRSGHDPDHIWGGLTWAIVPGIVGARLWFILFPPISLTAGCGVEGELCQNTAWFIENFFDLENGAIAIWNGGLSIFGGMLGGALGVYLYLSHWHNRIVNLLIALLTPILWLLQYAAWLFGRLRAWVMASDAAPFRYERRRSDFPAEGIPLTPWMDIAGVAIPLAQAIGRFANYVNQELYGGPTNLPWGIQIPRGARVAPYESLIDYPADTLFHPLWAYEAVWSLVAFYVLWRIYHQYRERLLGGDILLLYVLQYSFIRFLLEFLRVEIAVIGDSSINSSQTITLIGFVAALAILIYRHRPGYFEAAKAAERAAEPAQ